MASVHYGRYLKPSSIWLARWLFVWLAYAGPAAALADAPDAHPEASLLAKYAALAEPLLHNPFKRALYLESSETSDTLKGDIYALVDYPFATFRAALDGPDEWCDVLILHINTKYCHATPDRSPILKVSLGKKYAQPLDDAHAIEFTYRVAKAAPRYLEIRLDAETGPLSTRDYRIRLQAVPVEGNRTFLQLSYSYAFGFTGQLAMKTYLATIGSGKVGFTVTGRQSDGLPEYIDGMRGVAERNTMRYYLAIDAYLGALAAPPPTRFQKRLQGWFNATEQYPRQLREVSRADYIDMKQDEYRRRRATP
jgi:hypothetical protein